MTPETLPLAVPALPGDRYESDPAAVNALARLFPDRTAG